MITKKGCVKIKNIKTKDFAGDCWYRITDIQKKFPKAKGIGALDPDGTELGNFSNSIMIILNVKPCRKIKK